MLATRRWTTVLAVSAASLLLLGSAAKATIPTDEQVTIDATIEAFGERMTAAGWESTGAPTDDDEDEDGDADAEDEAMMDAFSECLGADATELFNNLQSLEEFDGPSAESDEFTYAPPGDTPGSSEPMSFDIENEETVALTIGSLSDEQVPVAEQLIELVGGGDFAACFTEVMQTMVEEEMGGEDDAMAELVAESLELDVSSEDDLGIGEQSGRLSFAMSMTFIVSVSFEFAIDFVLDDGRLIGLVHGRTAGSDAVEESGFDPIAELEQVLADLAGS